MYWLLALATGGLLATGQFFMKKVAVGWPADQSVLGFGVYLVTNRNTFFFITANLSATLSYIILLRATPLVTSFIMVFLAMSVFVLGFDVFVNKASLPVEKWIGFLLGIVAFSLMANR